MNTSFGARKVGDPRGSFHACGHQCPGIAFDRSQSAGKSCYVSTLDVLLESDALVFKIPGRKLLFFASDGFISDNRGSNAVTMLKQVTQMAHGPPLSVYTMEAGGIYSDPAVDAGRNDFPDGIGSGTSARMPSQKARPCESRCVSWQMIRRTVLSQFQLHSQ